jgi:hypothetical protein
MNKEFPPNRWFRKYITPGRSAIFVLVMVAFTILGPKIIPASALSVVASILILTVISIVAMAMPLMIWQVYWYIKYPTKVESCKECGRVLPIKYED